MEIILAKNSGFCGGVANTVNKAQKYLINNQKAYILGDIVHNEQVIEELQKMGLIKINDVSEINSGTMIIRAHGEKKDVYDVLLKKKINIIDLTCPKVKKIHDLILENNNSFIIIIGKKKHPEVLGHVSYAKKYLVMETLEDVNILKDLIHNEKIKEIYIVAQTTFNNLLFDKIVHKISDECQNIEIKVNKTICNVTQIRQDEVHELSKKVHKMLIIGSKNSSNTKELYEVAKENCKDVYLINDIQELSEINFNVSDKIGIVGGASTPKEMLEHVKNYLQNKRNSL